MPRPEFATFEFHARNTPVQFADRFSAAIGLEPGRLWIKRDDLTGLVGGGNKARKLEYLVADALAAGADTLVTGGAAQSNHVRATAAAARAAGLRCVAVLAAEPVPAATEGNLVLDDLLGLEIVWTAPDDRYVAFEETMAKLVELGRVPYAIPLGGSSPLGAAAYAKCAYEITDQIGDDVTTVCAVGSGGTFAGLICGLASADHVLGFDVAAVSTIVDEVDRLIPATRKLTAPCLDSTKRASWELDRSMTRIEYGAPSTEVFAAIRLLADTEGLVLDPVYSGKAMAGLLAKLASGWTPGSEKLVFVHTGGLPALMTLRYSNEYRRPGQMAL